MKSRKRQRENRRAKQREERKHTDIRELNAEIIREFVERIEVFQAERVCGKKVQKLRIVWNCIGSFNPPQPDRKGKTA